MLTGTKEGATASGGRPSTVVWQCIRAHCIRATALAIALSFTGCVGGVALNRSAGAYNAALSDINNHQVLLNLARAVNRHPLLFLQVGNISSSFTFNTHVSANVAGSATEGRSNPVQGLATLPLRLLSRLLSWGATAETTAIEQPTFAFTPLTGSGFTKSFLNPIPSEVFFQMLDQGYPIDLLLRILVHRIEYTAEDGEREVLHNQPGHRDEFVRFLRLAGLTAELQQRNLIGTKTLRTRTLVPGPPIDAPNVDTLLKLAEKHMGVEPVPNQPGKFQIVIAEASLRLYVSDAAAEAVAELRKFPYFQVRPRQEDRGKTGLHDFSYKLRSFFEILTASATEQEAWDVLAKEPGFLESVPPSQRQPLLRLIWDGATEDLEPALVSLDYLGQTYAIRDVKGSVWNRSVFVLLSAMSSLSALDPKDLPVQQLIQIR